MFEKPAFKLSRTRPNAEKQLKMSKSLFICGYCGKDTRETGREVEKVVLSGLANILCRTCRESLKDDVMSIAKKYLGAKT